MYCINVSIKLKYSRLFIFTFNETNHLSYHTSEVKIRHGSQLWWLAHQQILTAPASSTHLNLLSFFLTFPLAMLSGSGALSFSSKGSSFSQSLMSSSLTLLSEEKHGNKNSNRMLFSHEPLHKNNTFKSQRFRWRTIFWAANSYLWWSNVGFQKNRYDLQAFNHNFAATEH